MRTMSTHLQQIAAQDGLLLKREVKFCQPFGNLQEIGKS